MCNAFTPFNTAHIKIKEHGKNYHLFGTYYMPGRGNGKILNSPYRIAPNIAEQMLAINPGMAGLIPWLRFSLASGPCAEESLVHYFTASS